MIDLSGEEMSIMELGGPSIGGFNPDVSVFFRELLGGLFLGAGASYGPTRINYSSPINPGVPVHVCSNGRVRVYSREGQAINVDGTGLVEALDRDRARVHTFEGAISIPQGHNLDVKLFPGASFLGVLRDVGGRIQSTHGIVNLVLRGDIGVSLKGKPERNPVFDGFELLGNLYVPTGHKGGEPANILEVIALGGSFTATYEPDRT